MPRPSTAAAAPSSPARMSRTSISPGASLTRRDSCAIASSSARSTKRSKLIPAASAAIGSSDVSVRPGIELTSSTWGPPLGVEHHVDAGEAVAAERRPGRDRGVADARSPRRRRSSAGQA